MTHQIRALLALVRQYDPDGVASALAKAQAAGAFGADYVANILLQEHSPREQQPALRLKDPRLNELVTDPLSLLEYDALIIPERRQP
jgi:predicted component of type VI protein secretion system